MHVSEPVQQAQPCAYVGLSVNWAGPRIYCGALVVRRRLYPCTRVSECVSTLGTWTAILRPWCIPICRATTFARCTWVTPSSRRLRPPPVREAAMGVLWHASHAIELRGHVRMPSSARDCGGVVAKPCARTAASRARLIAARCACMRLADARSEDDRPGRRGRHGRRRRRRQKDHLLPLLHQRGRLLRRRADAITYDDSESLIC
eukprot:6032090-Pleurochrysis_carterae.AAC.3